MTQKGKLFVVGFGPGDFKHITTRVVEAIQESDLIIGYKTYIDLIQDLVTEQTVVSTGMTEEVSRAQEAVKQAENGKSRCHPGLDEVLELLGSPPGVGGRTRESPL